jgi:hypothetical protein
MDLFDTLTWAKLLVKTTFLGTPTLTVLKGHLLVMDNYFSSIGHFEDLLSRGIYATDTMRTNRIGLPTNLKNTKAFKRSSQGTTEWRMH